MRSTIFTTAVLASTIIASAVHAQEAVDDTRFYAKGGVFFAKVDSNLRIDRNGGNLGSTIDLESDLGLATNKVLPFGLIGWRFSENWRAELEYFKLSRDHTGTIDRTLTVGNTTYPVKASLTAGLATDVYRLTFGYSFARGDDYEIGGNLGFHLSNFSVFAEGNGTVGNQAGAIRRESREQLVPLPTLGLYGRYDLNDTFGLVARASYFQLRISDYKGQLLDASVGVTAKINRNFGLGADFRYVDYKLRADANDFTGRINYNFYGPFVYAIVNF